METKEIVMNQIILRVESILDETQLEILQSAITIVLHDYDVLDQKHELVAYDNYDQFLMEQYYAALKVEGKSMRTITRYMDQIKMMMTWTQKPLRDMRAEDIRYYLAVYQQKRGTCNNTLDGMRRCICAFYSWCEYAGYIDKSPARRIKQIKHKVVQEPALTQGEIEQAMLNCRCLRDKAIISFMYETGARVSEVAAVKISDIDFRERTVLLHGKGDKDRIAMFTDRAELYLRKYLENRDQCSDRLFVSKYKNQPLSAHGIESIVHKLGERSGIERLHPHRFRVSRITHLIDRGMPIQDVQILAGHTNINTTQGYYRNTISNIKYSYKRAAQ